MFIFKRKLSREEINKTIKGKEDEKMLINFNDFQKVKFQKLNKVLLDFQIRTRDKYLRNFSHLFKKVDLDMDGIINEEEFILLLTLINKILPEDSQLDFELILNVLDPYNNKRIIFSECVQFLENVK